MRVDAVSDHEIEQQVLQSLSLDDARALLDRFNTLVRESGSRDEWTAARWIAARLKSWGVPHTLHDPELFLSVPKAASLEITSGPLLASIGLRTPAPRTIRAKTPAFSASTGRGSV